MTKGVNIGDIELKFNTFNSETTLTPEVVKENSRLCVCRMQQAKRDQFA
jgi:hypothetical protein